MPFFNKKYPEYRPYECIIKLDKAIKTLSECVYKQKIERKVDSACSKVIKYAAMLIASDAIANHALLCTAISNELRMGLIDASSRNTSVAVKAFACVESTLSHSNEFSDFLKDYEMASQVARGLENFKNMNYCGHLMFFSMHKSLINTERKKLPSTELKADTKEEVNIAESSKSETIKTEDRDGLHFSKPD